MDGVRHAIPVCYETLHDHFGANDSDGSMIKSFRDNADEMAEIAAQKIRNDEPARIPYGVMLAPGATDPTIGSSPGSATFAARRSSHIK